MNKPEIKKNPKFEVCVASLGRQPSTPEFLSWTYARGKEYASETGNPIPSPNCLNTVESNPIFENWLATNAGRPEWGYIFGDGTKQIKDMIEANIGLAVSVAHKFANRGISVEDLIQEGCIALGETITDKFEWYRGTTFATYALWYVKKSIQLYIANQGKTIRIPVHALADARHNPHGTYAEMINASSVVSCDLPIGEDGATLGDFIASNNTVDPSTEALRRIASETLAEMVHGVMDALNDQEQKVLVRRFGLADGKSVTLKEIGDEMDMTRERVRQIEAKALRKMRHHVAQPNVNVKAA
jgi:RNA polymerase sigma factor (sigma-70 family)